MQVVKNSFCSHAGSGNIIRLGGYKFEIDEEWNGLAHKETLEDSLTKQDNIPNETFGNSVFNA